MVLSSSAPSPPDSALMAASLFPSGFRQGGGGGLAPALGAQLAANRKQENKTAPGPTRLTLTLPPPSLAPAHPHGPLFLLPLPLGFASSLCPSVSLLYLPQDLSVLACPFLGQQVMGMREGRDAGSSSWFSFLVASPARAQPMTLPP